VCVLDPVSLLLFNPKFGYKLDKRQYIVGFIENMFYVIAFPDPKNKKKKIQNI
jgi:hypothetical protein